METKIATKSYIRLTHPFLDREARLAARKRAFGIWKGHTDAMIKENRKIRKEWDKRVKKLGW
jgi:hypothetical protein